MKTLTDKIDKKDIEKMPVVHFPGRIYIITTENEARKAVNYLLTFKVVGLDTETRPSFKKHVSYKVSLVQISTPDTCFLFRLNYLGSSQALKEFMESATIKVGLSLHDDIRMMHQRGDFKANNFVDIQGLVKEIGIRELSLLKLYAIFFGERISKRQQLSNWDCDCLTDAQKLYAATDAWACINLYNEINRLKETNDYEIQVTEDEENNTEER